MRTNTFDQTTPRITEKYDTHPYTSGGDFGFAALSAGYRLKPRIMLRLQNIQDREFSQIHGYHDPDTTPSSDPPTDRAYVTITPSIRTLAALAFYEARGSAWARGPPEPHLPGDRHWCRNPARVADASRVGRRGGC
jgi:hypothetical protein